MRLTRVFTPQPLTAGAELDLEQRPARHLLQVLRLRQGCELTLFNGDGRDYRARLVTGGRKSARAEILGCSDMEPQPLLQIDLAIGLSKGERMDMVVQKSVELGVSSITPLFTEHSVVRLSEQRMQQRMAHWNRVAIAACEQSGRRRLPLLHAPVRLESWLDADRSGLLLDQQASASMHQLPSPGRTISLLVGPEGGFAQRECSLALTSGLRGVRLGPRILRTETAPLAAIAAIQALWGDFRAC